MRRKDREITDVNEIEAIVKKAIRCCIGLVDNYEPYIVPVCFGYERNALYFHGALEGRRINLIKKNNKACFEIDTDMEVVKGGKPCQWTMKYRSVIGAGKAYILESDEEKAHGLKLIMKQYTGGDFSFTKPELNSVLVVRIDIENITGKKAGY